MVRLNRVTVDVVLNFLKVWLSYFKSKGDFK